MRGANSQLWRSLLQAVEVTWRGWCENGGVCGAGAGSVYRGAHRFAWRSRRWRWKISHSRVRRCVLRRLSARKSHLAAMLLVRKARRRHSRVTRHAGNFMAAAIYSVYTDTLVMKEKMSLIYSGKEVKEKCLKAMEKMKNEGRKYSRRGNMEIWEEGRIIHNESAVCLTVMTWYSGGGGTMSYAGIGWSVEGWQCGWPRDVCICVFWLIPTDIVWPDFEESDYVTYIERWWNYRRSRLILNLWCHYNLRGFSGCGEYAAYKAYIAVNMAWRRNAMICVKRQLALAVYNEGGCSMSWRYRCSGRDGLDDTGIAVMERRRYLDDLQWWG